MEATEQVAVATTVHIHYDTEPQNPREDGDNFGTMACAHRRYNLGDEEWRDVKSEVDLAERVIGSEEVERIDAWKEREYKKRGIMALHGDAFHKALAQLENDRDARVVDAFDKLAIRLPMYMYDHSGQSVSTKPFSCPWDSGRIGTIFVTLEKVRKERMVRRVTKKLRAEIVKMLESEVEVYDNFVSGQVYGYSVHDQNGGEMESCWGFYGNSPKTNGGLEWAAQFFPKDHPMVVNTTLWKDPT